MPGPGRIQPVFLQSRPAWAAPLGSLRGRLGLFHGRGGRGRDFVLSSPSGQGLEAGHGHEKDVDAVFLEMGEPLGVGAFQRRFYPTHAPDGAGPRARRPMGFLEFKRMFKL